MSVFTSDVTVEPGSNPINVTVGNFPATQPVSGTVTANQGTAAAPAGSWPIEITDGTNVLGTSAHPLQTISAVASTSTVTQVVATANTNTVLLAANPNRKRAILFFPKGNMTTFVKLGATASATSWTYTIIGNDTIVESADWNGEIDYFGQAQTINVTELV